MQRISLPHVLLTARLDNIICTHITTDKPFYKLFFMKRPQRSFHKLFYLSVLKGNCVGCFSSLISWMWMWVGGYNGKDPNLFLNTFFSNILTFLQNISIVSMSDFCF